MIVSLFSLIVARGAEVPVVDPRLASHVGYASRVDTPDQGPATQADWVSATDALDAQPASTTSSGSTDAVAPSGAA
jgi:hypothetical protein